MVSLSVRVINAPPATTPKNSGGGSRKPNISVQVVTPEVKAVSSGKTATAPQTYQEQQQRVEQIKQYSKDIGRGLTSVEVQRFMGGARATAQYRRTEQLERTPDTMLSPEQQQIKKDVIEARRQIQEQARTSPESEKRNIQEVRPAPQVVIEKPQSVVTAFEAPKGILERILYEIQRAKSRMEIERIRGKDVKVVDEAKQFGLGVAATGVGTALFIKNIVTEPISTIKSIPEGVKTSAEQFGTDVQTNPSFALGTVVANIVGAKAIPKALGKTGTVTENILTRLDPRFKAVTTTTSGQFIENLPPSVGATRIGLVRPGNLGNLNLAEQASFAGRTTTVVTAQRGLFGLFETTKTIDKPLPSPTAPPLERAMFFSPPNIRTGVPELRVSRLGLQGTPQASFLDIVGGGAELSIRPNRPQAIVLPNAKIANIPSELLSVLERAKKGDAVAIAEFERRFLEYQLRPTGELQPIGFAATKEAELTLSPQSILAKKGTPAVTIIQGKRVPIIVTEIVQPSSEASRLISKLQSQGLSVLEREKLTQILKKETGLDYSKAVASTKRLPIESASGFIRTPRDIARVDSLPVSQQVISPQPIKRSIAPQRIIRPEVTPRRTISPNVIREIIKRGNIPIRTPPQTIRGNLFTKTPPTPIPKSRLDSAGVITSADIEGYKVFTRKFGGDVLLGTARTKEEASRILSRELKGTLRASGFVTTSTGEKLKATELNLGRGFRPGKRDSFRIVQERGTRLGSFGEIREIQSSRRRTSKAFRL